MSGTNEQLRVIASCGWEFCSRSTHPGNVICLIIQSMAHRSLLNVFVLLSVFITTNP